MPHRLNEVLVLVLNDNNVANKVDAGTLLSKLTVAKCLTEGGTGEGAISDTG